ncbi:MAG: spore cortex biosynthesis protein YabQ [Oscillospiraceae bacterium]|jgi:spore cortex biosynthesis protein YabQ|nr:spore cortex biosynthesis protein YabQ [Oscillospiraceae bacterium]
MFATAGQAHIFLATVVAGLFTGALYDILSVIRRITKHETSFTSVVDFLFWIAAAIVFITVVVFTGGDGLRWYMLLGFGAGLVLYLVGIHIILTAAFGKLTRLIRNIKRRFSVVRK